MAAVAASEQESGKAAVWETVWEAAMRTLQSSRSVSSLWLAARRLAKVVPSER